MSRSVTVRLPDDIAAALAACAARRKVTATVIVVQALRQYMPTTTLGAKS